MTIPFKITDDLLEHLLEQDVEHEQGDKSAWAFNLWWQSHILNKCTPRWLAGRTSKPVTRPWKPPPWLLPWPPRRPAPPYLRTPHHRATHTMHSLQTYPDATNKPSIRVLDWNTSTKSDETPVRMLQSIGLHNHSPVLVRGSARLRSRFWPESKKCIFWGNIF